MKHRFLVVSLTAMMALVAGSSLVFAHHSVSATYIHGKSVTIDGKLKEFLWRNPHSFMKVEAPDESGELQIWVIEGAAPAQLVEQGLATNTLRPGDRIIVTGQPGRLAEDHRLLLHTVERPSDGFKWSSPNAPQ